MLAAKFLFNSMVQTSCATITTCRTMTSTSFRLGQKSRKALDECDQNVPIRPKKPVTAYLRFVQDRKDDILRENKMTAAQMAVILSREWKIVDRSKYDNDYQQQREEYLRQLENYEQSLTDSQREYLSNKKSLAKESKLLRNLRKTKPPRRPRNAANIFCAEKLKEPTTNRNLRDGQQATVLSQLFQEYRALSNDEKKKYLKLQEEDKIRFQQEFNQWFDGIISDTSLPKSLRDKAEDLRTKYKLLSYI